MTSNIRFRNLPDLLTAFNDLIEQAKALCPDVIPPPETALTDSVLIDLLVSVALASGVIDLFDRLNSLNMFPEFLFHDEAYWLIDRINAGKLTPDIIANSIYSIGEECLVGFDIFRPTFSWDDYEYILDEKFVPLSICLMEPHNLPSSPGDVFSFELGGDCDSSLGALSLAISPLTSNYAYKERVIKLADKSAGKKILREFPILAFLADDLGIPGRVSPDMEFDNFLLGRMTRGDMDRCFSFWTNIYLLNRDLAEVEFCESVKRKTSLSPEWLFGECLRTFNLKREGLCQ